jgi:hypothetical protein
MKIAYIVGHSFKKKDGVYKKIIDQVEVWKIYNINVKIFCLSFDDIQASDIVFNYKLNSNYEKLFFINKKFINDLNEFSPDFIYSRYDFWSANFFYLSKKYKTIVELQTNDLDEFWYLAKRKQSFKSLLVYLYFRAIRELYFSNIFALIAVTNELSSLQQYKRFKKTIRCFPNGINLSRCSIVKKNVIHKPSLFFIGSPGCCWHGVDIIVKIAQSLKHYDFHIVGYEGNSADNIQYHGFLDEHHYLKILRQCDVCIGSLALFRINMKEACPLKVREYLAFGFPVILGYKDTSFISEKKDFILELDFSDEKNFPLNLKIFDAFVKNNYHKIVKHEELCSIDIKTIESKKINFFNQIIFGRS